MFKEFITVGGGMASFGNKMRWLLFWGIIPLLACHQVMPKKAPASMSITPDNAALVAKVIEEADYIFLGRLSYRDSDWKPCPGAIVMSQAKMKFKILKAYKGFYNNSRIAIWYPFVCKNPEYVEYGGLNGAGFRLSSKFFITGYTYIIFSKKIKINEEGDIHYYIFDDNSIVMATDENVKKLEKILGQGSKEQ